MNSEEIKQLDHSNIAGTYARFDVCFTHGKNATCYDCDDKAYIDLGSGIGVNSLGYCDEDWAAAVCAQAQTLQHTSNLYYTEPCVKLAKMLTEATGYQKVFFCNSGAEANEGAIKTARKYSFDHYGQERNTILTLVNSFHGRTVTTLAATGQEVFHNFFFPFTDGFAYAMANDQADFDRVVAELDGKLCAVMVEFVQGEGGVTPLDTEFVAHVAKVCADRDLLLIADEVQTGMGRTGKLLASEHYQIKPDITTLAKGLGGGLPIGAFLLNDKTADVLGKSHHGTTFGGNPVVCAGAVAVMEKLLSVGFLEDVERKGQRIRAMLEQNPQVASIDGLGLMLGIRLKTKQAVDVVKACIQAGAIPLTAKEKVRLLPPLTITDAELEQGIAILDNVLKA